MMNMPAARLTDLHVCIMCPPGAPILGPGMPTVLVGSLPQARMTDLCVCIPPPPFGPGDAIMTGSPTVLVGGLPAARMFDLTAKAGLITTGQPNVLIGLVGISIPKLLTSLGTFLVSVLMDIGSAVADGLSEGFDTDLCSADWCKLLSVKWTPGVESEGWLGKFSGKLEVRLFELDGVGHIPLPFIGGVGAAGKYSIGQIDLGLKGGVVQGADVSGQARAAWGTATGSVFVGDDPNNPYEEIGATVNVLQAEAAGDVTLGEGGYGTGVKVRGKAAAEVVAGDIFQEQNIPVGDGNTVSTRAKVGASAGSVGGEYGGWAEQDKGTGRTHVGGIGKVEAGVGLGVSGDVSYGPAYEDRGGRKF